MLYPPEERSAVQPHLVWLLHRVNKAKWELNLIGWCQLAFSNKHLGVSKPWGFFPDHVDHGTFLMSQLATPQPLGEDPEGSTTSFSYAFIKEASREIQRYNRASKHSPTDRFWSPVRHMVVSDFPVLPWHLAQCRVPAGTWVNIVEDMVKEKVNGSASDSKAVQHRFRRENPTLEAVKESLPRM